MKKFLLSLVFVSFLFSLSFAQTNKDLLKKQIRVSYNSINKEIITKTYFNEYHKVFVEVYNITGNFIKRFNYYSDTQIFSNQLLLKQGIYILKIFDNNTYYTKRIIVKN